MGRKVLVVMRYHVCHHRRFYLRDIFLILLLCLLSAIPAFAQEIEEVTLPFKDPVARDVRESNHYAVTELVDYVDHVTRQYSFEISKFLVKVLRENVSA